MPKGDYHRLKADIEDGIVPIAHLLLEALSMAKLNGVAKGLVLFIWRRTYGWSEEGKRKYKDDRITLAEFASAVNSERTYVSTQLKLLVRNGVLYERQDDENGRYKRYGMNTDISAWSEGVIDVDKLVHTVGARLYVHSSRNVLQTHNGFANAQPFVDTQPLSNSTTKPLCDSTTFAPENPLPSAGSEAPEIKKEINKKIDEEDEEAASARALDQMDVKEFENEVEAKLQQLMLKPTYCLIQNDFKILRYMLTDGVERQFILNGIDEAFEAFKPKHRLDKISSFAFCARRIYDRWQVEIAKREATAAPAQESYVLPRAGPTRAPQSKPTLGQRDERYTNFYALFETPSAGGG